MKFLVFGDPHITPQCEFGKPDEYGRTDYLLRVSSSIEWITGLVLKYSPEIVVCLGDLFDSTGYVDTASLTMASYVCSKLSSACLEEHSILFFLLGNHDKYSERFNNLSFMSLDPNINVISKETKYELKGNLIQFIPWTEEEATFDPECNIVFSHLLMEGGYLYKDKQSEKGTKCKYGEHQVIFNGHHHRNQVLSKNFYNVGSLLSRTFQDVNSGHKGVYLYDSETRKAKFIINPYEIPFKEILIDNEEKVDTILHNVGSGHIDYSDSYVRIKFNPEFKTQVEDIACFTKDCRLEAIQQKPDLDKSFVSDLFSVEENFKEYTLSLIEDDTKCNEILELGFKYIEKVSKENSNLHKLSLEFCGISICNFQSIESIETNLQNNGIVAITGVNGSGKSSFLEAIYWVLTGESIRGYKGDDVIQWGKNFCEVSLDLIVGGEVYRVTRRKEKKKSYELNVNVLSAESNIDIRRASDSEKLLGSLIGRTKDILKHSVFLTSDLSTKFTSLSYPDRVRLFESITNVEVYQLIGNELHKDLVKCQKDVLVSESKIESLNSNIEHLNKKVEDIYEEIVDFYNSDFDLDEKTKVVDDCKRKLGVIRSIRVNIEDTRGKLKEELYNVDSISRNIQSKVNNISLDKAKTEKERSLLIEQKEEVEKLVSDGRCYTCGSNTSNSPDLNEKLGGLAISIDRCDYKIIEYSNELDKMTIEIVKIDKSRQNIEEKLNVISGKSKKLNTTQIELDKEVDKLQLEINESTNKLSSLEARRDELENLLATSKKEINECKLEYDAKIKYLYNLTFINKAFSTSGIRSVILESIAINFINSRLEYYSELIGFNCYLTNKVYTKTGEKRNKIDVELENKKSYKGCSRGEKRRIDLIIQCAINDLAISLGGSQINLLVADEIIDPLDSDGVSGFIELLKNKSTQQNNSTMLIVSHKPFFSELLNSSWVFTKNNGVTSLEIKNG